MNDTEQEDVLLSAEQVIEAYEHLLSLSARMLGWARLGDWSALIDEETRYVAEVNRLAEVEEAVILNETQQQRKADLLEQILEQSLEVKRYLAKQRDELGQKIQDTRQRRLVVDSYLDWDADKPGTSQ